MEHDAAPQAQLEPGEVRGILAINCGPRAVEGINFSYASRSSYSLDHLFALTWLSPIVIQLVIQLARPLNFSILSALYRILVTYP